MAVSIKFLLILSIVAFTCYPKTLTKKEIVLMDFGVNLNPGDEKYLCAGRSISFADTDWSVDENGHGTIMFNILKENLKPNECIIIYKVFDGKKRPWAEPYIYALNALSKMPGNQRIVLAMEDVSYDIREVDFFKAITKTKQVFVAAGNDGVELKKDCKVYPACLKRFIKSENFLVVGSLVGHNYGPLVDMRVDSKITINGKLHEGTSISTGRATVIYENSHKEIWRPEKAESSIATTSTYLKFLLQ